LRKKVSTLRLRERYKRLRKNMKGLVEGKCHRKVKEDADFMTEAR
jgi:hypothetical protein